MSQPPPLRPQPPVRSRPQLRDAPRGLAPAPAPAERGGGAGAGAVLLGVALGGLLGAAGGFAGGIFAYPLVAPRLASLLGPAGWMATASPAGSAVGLPDELPLATGRFVHSDPTDRQRWGSGSVAVYANAVRLGEDFQVAPGPKYHIYLVPLEGIDADTRVEESMFVDLGGLSSFVGPQTYPIPPGVAAADYPSVAVWSEQLNLLVSPAPLRPAEALTLP